MTIQLKVGKRESTLDSELSRLADRDREIEALSKSIRGIQAERARLDKAEATALESLTFHRADRERTLMAICERLKAPIGDDL